jgi:hypothetical protein
MYFLETDHSPDPSAAKRPQEGNNNVILNPVQRGEESGEGAILPGKHKQGLGSSAETRSIK